MRLIKDEGKNERKGDVYVKPNLVFAYNTKKMGSHAFTQPQFVGASLLALSGRDSVFRVDMGENSAMGFPIRFCYRLAGYTNEMRVVRKKPPNTSQCSALMKSPGNVFSWGERYTTP